MERSRSVVSEGSYCVAFDGDSVTRATKITYRYKSTWLDLVRKGNYASSGQRAPALVDTITRSTYLVDDEWSVCEHEIGDFPRYGDYKIDNHGAKVFRIEPGMVEILSYKDNTWSWEPVTEITWHNGAECVRCAIGHRTLETTANESIAVFDYQNGGLVKVSPLQCKPTDLIPVFKKDPMPYGNVGTRDEGWFLGSMISDGWVSKWYIGYCKTDPLTRGKMSDMLAAIFGKDKVVEITGKPGANKLAYSKALHVTGVAAEAYGHSLKMYAEVERDGKPALYKQIGRDRIHNGSEEFLWGLFCGLMDGDGSVPFSISHAGVSIQPRFATSSKFLVEDFKLLCYKLGIKFSVTVTPPRNWSAEAYTICLSASDFCANLRHMEFHGEKTCQIHDILSNEGTSPNDYIDVIPTTEEERRIVGCGLCPRRTDLKRIIKVRNLTEPKSLIDRVNDTGTVWYPVKKIEPIGKREVFDFVIPTTKVFAVNDGVVVYDTASSNGILSKQANEEVAKYLDSVGRYVSSNGKLTHIPTNLIDFTLFNLSRDPSMK